jgi:hypothetical protein
MAWTAPMTFTAANALTAAQLNTHLRDNLLETEVAVAMTPGAYIVSDAANSCVERIPQWQDNGATGNTTATAYGDMTTGGPAGPTVTVTCGDKCLVLWNAEMHNTVSVTFVLMTMECSGATTVAASDNWALGIKRSTPNRTFQQGSMFHLFTGLTPGVNTFTAKYRVTAGEGWYNYRRVYAIPL